jgi:hypothetical protein
MALHLGAGARPTGRLDHDIHSVLAPVRILRQHRNLPAKGIEVPFAQADLVGKRTEQRVEPDQILQRFVVGGIVDRHDPHLLTPVEDPKQVAADPAQPGQPNTYGTHSATPSLARAAARRATGTRYGEQET